MKTFYLISKVRPFFLVAVLSVSVLVSVFGQIETAQAATCSFTRNEEKTAITERCSGGGNITLEQESAGGQKYSREYGAVGDILTKCKEQITMASNTQGTHKVFYGAVEQKGVSFKCGAVSMGSVSVSSSGGSGASSVRNALNDIINKDCSSQPNNTLRTECVSTWENIINQCVAAEKNAKGSDSYKDSVAKCIANKKSYSESAIRDAIKNIDKDIENLDKIEACQKDSKDYDKDLDKCVEICEDGQSLDKDGKCVDGTSCAVDGIGWIVCPVLTFLGKLNDVAFSFLNNFLEVPSRIFNDAATKSAWEAFRNLANVAFVMAFLIIIYSQITGTGLSNYGLKKMLPKLVIAAILVNVSFYICAIAVDISNIVGASLYELLKEIEPGTGDSGGGAGSGAWSVIMASVLGVVAGVGLLAVIVFAPMSLLAFALVILILIARQAFVILLIVISPLAFVAYLLPNTEQWFKKWWKMFSALLLVFPTVALVFGAGSLASRILMNVAQDGPGGGDDEQLLKIVAAGVLAIPLFAVPALLKGAMAATGSIGGKIAGLQNSANRGAGKAIKSGRIGEAKTAFDARRQVKRFNRRTGDGFGSSINKKIDNSKFGKYIGGDRGAALATSSLYKEFGEEVGRQKSTMNGLDHADLMNIVKDKNASEERRAAAAGVVGSRSFRKGHQELLDYLGDESHVDTAGKVDDAIKTVQQQASYDMKDQPLGMGDKDKSALGEGKFTKPRGKNAAGTKRTVSQEGILQRLEEGKISEQSFAGMNPDDLALVADLKSGGHLTPAAQATIDGIIDRLRDPSMATVYASSKGNARKIHDILHS